MHSDTREAENFSPDRPDFEEEIWETLDPFLFPPKAFKSAHREIEAILEIADLKKGPVLDLACGPGRHAIPLAKKGFDVTGVDRSFFLLSKARNYALREGVFVEFINDDMRFFSRRNSYDLALSLYSSFGYFDDPGDNQNVLNCIHKSLKKGGTLFLDLPGREVLARNFKKTIRKKVQNLGQITEYRTVSAAWKRLGLSWRFYKDCQLKNYKFELWLYSGEEIKTMLSRAGFSPISLFGDFNLNPYDHKAKQLIAFAVKE